MSTVENGEHVPLWIGRFLRRLRTKCLAFAADLTVCLDVYRQATSINRFVITLPIQLHHHHHHHHHHQYHPSNVSHFAQIKRPFSDIRATGFSYQLNRQNKPHKSVSAAYAPLSHPDYRKCVKAIGWPEQIDEPL